MEVVENKSMRESFMVLLGVGFILTLAALASYFHGVEKINAPIAGCRWFWEPALLLRLRFIWNSEAIVENGYRRVRQ